MQPMYPDSAQVFCCPFALPTEKFCLADRCFAWEIAPHTDGECGYCARLSRRRSIVVLGTVETCEVIDPICIADIDDQEVPR